MDITGLVCMVIAVAFAGVMVWKVIIPDIRDIRRMDREIKKIDEDIKNMSGRS